MLDHEDQLNHEDQTVQDAGVELYPGSSTIGPHGSLLLGEALDLIVAMLAELIEHSAADSDDFVDDLDRLSHIASRLH